MKISVSRVIGLWGVALLLVVSSAQAQEKPKEAAPSAGQVAAKPAPSVGKKQAPKKSAAETTKAEPAAKKPVDEKSAEKAAPSKVEKKPAAEKSAAEKPADQKPADQKPAARNPIAKAAKATGGPPAPKRFSPTPFPAIPSEHIATRPFAFVVAKLCEIEGTVPVLAVGADQDMMRVHGTTSKILDFCKKVRDSALDKDALDNLKTALTEFKAKDAGAIVYWAKRKFVPAELTNALTQPGLQASGALTGGLTSLQSDLINGLSQFLARRAKQEALAYLKLQLQERLCGTEPNKYFFPATCQAIGAVDDSQPLQSISTTLRAAAEKDLKALPDVLLAYIGHYHQSGDVAAELSFAARYGYAFARGLADGRAPDELLAQTSRMLSENPKLKVPAKMGEVLHVSSAIAYALLENGVADNDRLDKILELNGYGKLGFSYALLMTAHVQMGDPSPLKAPVLARLAKPTNGVTKLVDRALGLREAYAGLKAQLKDRNTDPALKKEQLALGLRKIGLLTGQTVGTVSEVIFECGQGNEDEKCKALSKSRTIIEAGSSIAADISERKYAGATLVLFEHFSGTLKDATEKAAKLEKEGETKKSFEHVQRYVQFVIEIAQADGSDGVAAVLDTYASPLGSYRTKYTRVVVGVGGLLGVFAGSEQINADGVQGNSAVLGGFAPVGLEVSFPIEKWVHLGLMASLLDVGALTTYRFKQELDDDDQASHEPNVTLKQVFSPGAYVTLGIARSPFVIGGGLSYSPELRDVAVDGGSTITVPSIRYGGFAAVDVPLFMF